MKALTLHQPWASLVAWGEKRIETRSWFTNYRGPLAIHAARKLPLNWRYFAGGEIADALTRHGVPWNQWRAPDLSTLPTGVVVAVAWLTDCVEMRGVTVPGHEVSEQEREFGSYGTGRYAWILDEVKPLHAPYYPLVGRQGLFNVRDTDALLMSNLIDPGPLTEAEMWRALNAPMP